MTGRRHIGNITLVAHTKLEVRGYSDDTFMICGRGVDIDHDDCARDTTREIRIVAPDGSGLIIRGKFGEGAGWLIGVAPLNEDKPYVLPVTMRQDKYTMIAEVDATDGATITMEVLP